MTNVAEPELPPWFESPDTRWRWHSCAHAVRIRHRQRLVEAAGAGNRASTASAAPE